MANQQDDSGSERALADVMLTFARQFLSGVLQIIIMILVARIMGAADVGALQLALLLPLTLSQILNLGLSSASVYLVASEQYSLQQAWESSRNTLASIAILGTAGGLLFATSGLSASVFPGVPNSALCAALFIFPFSLMTNLAFGMLQSIQQFRSMNLGILFQPILALSAIALLWGTGNLDLTNLIDALVWSHVLTFLLSIGLLTPHCRVLKNSSWETGYLSVALRYGIKAHFSNILTFLNYRLDLLLVNLFAGTAAAGLYAVAVRLAEQIWIFSEAVATVVYPKLASLRTVETAKGALLSMMTRIVLWSSACVAGIIALLSDPLIDLLFGSQFVGAATPLLLLLPGAVLMSGARVLAHDVAARGMVGINLAYAAAALVVNVSGNLLLIPALGMAGAAVATSLTYTLMFGGHILLQDRYFGRKGAQFLRLEFRDFQALAQSILKGHR